MSGRLAQKRALVTGGANGIGREIARRFHAEGASLALFDIADDSLSQAAAELGATGLRCDVSDPDAVTDGVAKAIEALGGLDIIVNAAGVACLQPFDTISLAQWQRLFEVNLRAPALICAAALPALRESAGASIINISSYAGVKPSPFTSAYGATKAGLLMFTKSLAHELGPIRANAICPGAIDTQMTAAMMAAPEDRARIESSNAVKRIGQPSDIAAAAVFLAGDESRFVSGTQIVVDGGSSYY